ncbi:MAG: SCO family protein, partial [Solirubrobacteraceae bacterium]
MPASVRLQRLLMGVLVALVAAIVLVVVSSGAGSGSPAAAQGGFHSQFDGPTMPPHLRAADFTLRNVNGTRVSLAADRGKVVVLTFIHSLCHDTCPFMVEQIKGALNSLPGNGAGVVAVGVSADPSEDTVRNRRHFLAQHEMAGRLAFLNGPMAVMRRIWHAYGIQP